MSETQTPAADTATTTPDTGSNGADPEFLKAEAKRAFIARDAEKKRARELEDRLRALEGIDPEEHKALKQQAEKAEEERKRKAGEFDSWRGEILKKTEAEKAAIAAERDAAKTELEKTLIGLKFAGASSLFGESGKTVLTPEIAEAYFSRYVSVEEIDGRKTVVVKDNDGHVILNAKTGKPADFAEAMAEVIEAMPNKAHIFRGSGKTGSGSSGGSTTATQQLVDTARLKSGDFSDPKVREAVKRQQAAAGGLQIGRAFDQRK
jgi:hypothetical protein